MQIILLIILISAHIIFLSKLIFFPYPELFIYPYLTKIGLVPYKDILDQHFPGLMFFPINLATLGIDTPNEMRLLQYLLVVVCHLLIFLVAKSLKLNKLVILPNILYLIWQPYLEGYVLWIDSFVAPILLAAFYFAQQFEKNKQKNNLVVVGILLGVSTLFKQVAIPFIITYLFYLWFKYKKIVFVEYLILGLALPAAYLIFFVYRNNIFQDFVYWTYSFNVGIFAEMGRKFITFTEIVKIFPIFLMPLIGILAYLLKGRRKELVELNLLLLFFLGSLIFVYARFDYVHLQPALPFAILLSVSLANIINFKRKLLIVTFLVISLFITVREYGGLIGDKVMFYGENETNISEIVTNYTDPGEVIFAFGTLPHIYQMTNTIPPGKVFVFQFPWFMLKAEDRIFEGIQSEPPKVIVRDKNSSVSDINLVSYMKKIDSYIDKYYHTVQKIGEVEIMIPN